MKPFDKILKELKAPFEPSKLRHRIGATNIDKKTGQLKWGDVPMGIPLFYVSATDVMNRLDEVCEGYWRDEYPREGYCEISLWNGSEWVKRGNGAGETDIEGEKGRYSDAFKRAAVKWGPARYLYYLDFGFIPLTKNKRGFEKLPDLPKWALPGYVPRMDMTLQKEYAQQFSDLIVAADADGLKQLQMELDNETELPYVWRHLNSAQRETIKMMTKE